MQATPSFITAYTCEYKYKYTYTRKHHHFTVFLLLPPFPAIVYYCVKPSRSTENYTYEVRRIVEWGRKGNLLSFENEAAAAIQKEAGNHQMMEKWRKWECELAEAYNTQKRKMTMSKKGRMKELDEHTHEINVPFYLCCVCFLCCARVEGDVISWSGWKASGVMRKWI